MKRKLFLAWVAFQMATAEIFYAMISFPVFLALLDLKGWARLVRRFPEIRRRALDQVS